MARQPEHPPFPAFPTIGFVDWVCAIRRLDASLSAMAAQSGATMEPSEVVRRVDQWAQYARGWHGPRGAPKMAIEYSAVFGPQGAEPEWPAEVYQTENALTALGLADKRKLKVIKWRWLANYSYREIERSLRIRNGDGRQVVDEAIRALADVFDDMT